MFLSSSGADLMFFSEILIIFFRFCIFLLISVDFVCHFYGKIAFLFTFAASRAETEDKMRFVYLSTNGFFCTLSVHFAY